MHPTKIVQLALFYCIAGIGLGVVALDWDGNAAIAQQQPPVEILRVQKYDPDKQKIVVPPVEKRAAPYRDVTKLLSQSEIAGLRARLMALWKPPTVANPQEVTVRIRIRLKTDGTLAGPPIVLTIGSKPSYIFARDSAVRAVFLGQPFDMLTPEHYDWWKDIEITFSPPAQRQ